MQMFGLAGNTAQHQNNRTADSQAVNTQVFLPSHFSPGLSRIVNDGVATLLSAKSKQELSQARRLVSANVYWEDPPLLVYHKCATRLYLSQRMLPHEFKPQLVTQVTLVNSILANCL